MKYYVADVNANNVPGVVFNTGFKTRFALIASPNNYIEYDKTENSRFYRFVFDLADLASITALTWADGVAADFDTAEYDAISLLAVISARDGNKQITLAPYASNRDRSQLEGVTDLKVLNAMATAGTGIKPAVGELYNKGAVIKSLSRLVMFWANQGGDTADTYGTVTLEVHLKKIH